MASDILLGIDTGGTYTDAVLFSETRGVIAKAKSLTTRHDLSVGISGAVEAVLTSSGVLSTQVSLVSLSTTLATNALVEGHGGRAGLVMIGFGPEDLGRDGLDQALGKDPVVFLKGGHDVHGTETPLELGPLESAMSDLKDSVTSFAVAGYFAVRNPSHELKVRDFLRSHSPLPVTCSHQLSSKLGGPRRALTTLLNSRLVSMIDRLVGACEDFMRARGITAPTMVVRGDGALISAAEARLRPIETILSGPAASLIGAQFLTGRSDAVVSDIGGTTTDVAILDKGRPRLDAEGAVVGGYRTMVEAVAMRTYGLGGDSEVRVNDRGLAASIELGPRRLMPLSLAAWIHGDEVSAVLERQLKASYIGRYDGRFAVRTGVPARFAAGLEKKEIELFDRIGMVPVPLDQLISVTPQKATLDRLVSRGLVHVCGVTPSDALHVLDRQHQWDRESALLGLELLARTRDGAGRPIADSAVTMANRIVDRLTRQSADLLIASALSEDGVFDVDPARSPMVDRALNRAGGIVRLSISLDRPLIGLGASAREYYPAIAAQLSAESIVPDEADVANAVGAVVGQVRSAVTVFVTSPEEGRFVLAGAGENRLFADEAQALAAAEERARAVALEQAIVNGANDPAVLCDVFIQAPEIEGRKKLIEARIVATASGRPRFAS
ncbi:hydantoinase/oxoprolinase family protein [Ciceribacter sp. L1K22]|uniref:hydantoinase/oxoprolinase family protein n=1 Tax=Ciceribacter sp. L1K22 TaxID=2820275 RepID=UPI001ABE2F42|nr:hydantoinase/oxoprolinase family protein [Ciceribacter sp. L1K22]